MTKRKIKIYPSRKKVKIIPKRNPNTPELFYASIYIEFYTTY